MNFFDVLFAEKLGGEGTLIKKTITENGTYNATDDNANGFSSVTVNVPSIESMDKMILSNDSSPIATWLYAPLSAADIDMTCYAILKAPTGNFGGSGEIFLVSAPYAAQNGNCPGFFAHNSTNQVIASVYGGDTTLSDIMCDTYHVYTLAINSTSKKAKYYVDGTLKAELSFTHSGGYVVIGAGNIDGTMYNGRRPLCKYLGVVEALQSDADIIAKQQELMEKYGIT